jgi:hypothetical protein
VVNGTTPHEHYRKKLPRGRVLYDTVAGRFHLYADRRILTDKKLMEEIIAQLRLAEQRIEIAPDVHSRSDVVSRLPSDLLGGIEILLDQLLAAG